MINQYVTGDNKIICPICGAILKQLNTHLLYKHNMTISEFKMQYPNCPLRLKIVHEGTPFECSFCGKKFKTNSALQTHISYKHGNQVYGSGDTKIKRRRAAKTKGIECLICHNKFINFKQHIEMFHKMSWSNYCNQYNYRGASRYYDDEMKRNTSIAKKAFYQTEAGLAWKKWNGARVAGEKNSAKRKDVREKISKSREHIDNTTFIGYGINIWFRKNDTLYHCRSLGEYIVMCCLFDNNIPFEYEKTKVYYTLNNIQKLHITDFKINNTIYELKSYSESRINENSFKGHEKYDAIREKMKSLNINYKIVNLKMLLNELNITNIYTINKKKFLLDHMNEIIKIQICRSKNTATTMVECGDFNQFKDKINIIRF